MPSAPPPVVITRLDLRRLEALLDGDHVQESVADALRAELDRAQVVEPGEMPADAISMNTRARFRDTSTGQEREMTLVYPQDADASAGRVSILAPVGSALLGLRVGHRIEWPAPGGRMLELEVLDVLEQPGAPGDAHG